MLRDRAAPDLEPSRVPQQQAGSIQELVLRAQDGDKAALDLLIREIRPPICMSVRSSIGAELRAHYSIDDIAQEVLIRIVRSLSEKHDYYENGGSLRHWIACLVTRELCDAKKYATAGKRDVRRTAHFGVVDPEHPQMRRLSERDAGLEALEKDEVFRALLEGLDRLPPQEADLLRWIHFDGITAEAAAQKLGVSLRTVHRWQRRAQAQLEKYLIAAGVDR